MQTLDDTLVQIDKKTKDQMKAYRAQRTKEFTGINHCFGKYRISSNTRLFFGNFEYDNYDSSVVQVCIELKDDDDIYSG